MSRSLGETERSLPFQCDLADISDFIETLTQRADPERKALYATIRLQPKRHRKLLFQLSLGRLCRGCEGSPGEIVAVAITRHKGEKEAKEFFEETINYSLKRCVTSREQVHVLTYHYLWPRFGA